MPRRGTFAAILCLLVLTGARGDAVAEAAPRFDLDICTWIATHVVVATEGRSIDGTVTVLESWVGSLAPGTELRLPRLAGFAPRKQRVVHERLMVTGARMVIFLRRTAGARTWAGASASKWGDMAESVCWIEDGAAYALSDRKRSNRDPTFIAPLGRSEKALRARVRHLRQAKTGLAEIRGESDVPKRVTEAAKYVDADSSLVVGVAFDILKGCGKAAVPFLLSLPEQDAAGGYRQEIYETLGAIGDPSAVKPLVKRLEKELAFWKQAKDELDEGWWNGERMGWRQSRHYYAHLARVYYPLEALTAIAAPGHEDIVRRTRTLWLSAPALRGVNHGSIVSECDRALMALESARRRSK